MAMAARVTKPMKLASAYDGGVHHQPLHVRLTAERLEDVAEGPALDPVVVALLDGGHLAEPLGQVGMGEAASACFL
jgi:hypothetical protein